MKKHLYLMPVMALSLASFALAGCDDNKDETPTPETTSESTMPAAPDAATAEATTTEQAQASVIVSEAQAYATAPSATTGAIFAKINNTTSSADFLLSAKTDVATTVEIHQTYEDPQTGATLMRKTSGADVPANGALTLEPKGYHIMLLGLTKPLTAGESFNVTLSFREAGDVVVPVTIVSMGADTMDHTGHEMAPDATATDATAATETAPAESLSGDEEVAPAPEATPAPEAPADDAAAQ